MTVVLALAIALIVGAVWYLGNTSETQVVVTPAVAPGAAVSPTSDIDADLSAVTIDSSDADVQALDADLNKL